MKKQKNLIKEFPALIQAIFLATKNNCTCKVCRMIKEAIKEEIKKQKMEEAKENV
ncbi:MAG: hypothetical protein QXJ14_02545 [Candidatus Aenigmatarchaeota archaeon]